MNTYEVRYIRNVDEATDKSKHLVVEVQAKDDREARERAHQKATAQGVRLAQYAVHSVEVKHFG